MTEPPKDRRFRPRKINPRPFGWGFLAGMLAVFLLAGAALAHNVIVFAWVEGDTVHTEGKFQSGRKVHGGEILVHDAAGRLLLRGRTDENGAFSFKAPGKGDLKIALNAGMGHQGEWTVTAEELQAAEPAAGETVKAAGGQESEKGMARAEDGAGAPAGGHGSMDPDLLQAAVEKALDRKLAPVVRMLAESRQTGPGVTEIFGGLGYILGLVGLGAFIRYRRRNNGKG